MNKLLARALGSATENMKIDVETDDRTSVKKVSKSKGCGYVGLKSIQA